MLMGSIEAAGSVVFSCGWGTGMVGNSGIVGASLTSRVGVCAGGDGCVIISEGCGTFVASFSMGVCA